MKIIIIHGQSHKGSTYNVSRILADKLGGEVSEFFYRRISIVFVLGVGIALPKERSCVHISNSCNL